MANTKAAVRTSHDPSFKMARTDASANILILALRVAVNDKSQPWFWEEAASADYEESIERKSRHSENPRKENEHVPFRDMKSVVEEFVVSEMAAMVEETLDDVLLKTFHNAQIGIWSVLCNVVEQVMLDVVCRDVIGKMFVDHIARFFDMDKAAQGSSNGLVTLASFMAQNCNFFKA